MNDNRAKRAITQNVLAEDNFTRSASGLLLPNGTAAQASPQAAPHIRNQQLPPALRACLHYYATAVNILAREEERRETDGSTFQVVDTHSASEVERAGSSDEQPTNWGILQKRIADIHRVGVRDMLEQWENVDNVVARNGGYRLPSHLRNAGLQ